MSKTYLHVFSTTTQILMCIFAKPKVWKGFPGGSVVKNPPVNARATGVACSVPGLGRSPGGGNGNPLQYSCLGNPMDRGAQRGAAHVCSSHSVRHVQFFAIHRLQPTRLLCPWNSSGRNTGVGYFLLQGIFPTQGSNSSPALQTDTLLSGPPGKLSPQGCRRIRHNFATKQQHGLKFSLVAFG